MLDFVVDHWYLWAILFVICLGVVGYSSWKASQQKDFIVTGSVLIGCLIGGFQFIGAISAILTIISLLLKLFVWKITK